MICKKCGAENGRPELQAVYPDCWSLGPATKPVPDRLYARWACWKCGRYHFPDGTLYSNPYAAKPAEIEAQP